jgi:hypothetical protein
MKFFTAIKVAEFVSKLSTAAGFDFEAAFKSGNETALKAHIEKLVGDAKADPKLAEQLATLETALTEAKADNDLLEGTFAAIGVKLPAHKADATKEQQLAANKAELDKHISLRAQGLVGNSGHPPVGDKPDSGGVKTINRAAFSALSPKDQHQFFVDGGRLTD